MMSVSLQDFVRPIYQYKSPNDNLLELENMQKSTSPKKNV